MNNLNKLTDLVDDTVRYHEHFAAEQSANAEFSAFATELYKVVTTAAILVEKIGGVHLDKEEQMLVLALEQLNERLSLRWSVSASTDKV